MTSTVLELKTLASEIWQRYVTLPGLHVGLLKILAQHRIQYRIYRGICVNKTLERQGRVDYPGLSVIVACTFRTGRNSHVVDSEAVKKSDVNLSRVVCEQRKIPA